jgi:uncharacterized protein DUF4145
MPPSDDNRSIVTAHCPDCGGARNAAVMYEHKTTWDNEEAGISGQEKYRILKCSGCDTVYFQTISTNSEDYDDDGPVQHVSYWPAPSRRKEPTWMFEVQVADDKLHSLLVETYAALNNDARVLAAIGLRTIFDRVSEKLRVKQSLTFKDKLKALQSKGKIGKSELESLDVLTDAGGAAAHRGWKPTLSQLTTLMNIAEAFLHRTIIVDIEAKQLKKSIPRRKK